MLLEALGDLVIASSSLEESLKDAIWKLGGAATDDAQYRVASMPLGTLVDTFQKLYVAEPAGVAPVDKFCVGLKDLARDRSDLIHALWVFESGGRKAYRHRTKKTGAGLVLNTEAVTPVSVRALVGRFQNADDKLWEIIVPLFDRPEPSA